MLALGLIIEDTIGYDSTMCLMNLGSVLTVSFCSTFFPYVCTVYYEIALKREC